MAYVIPQEGAPVSTEQARAAIRAATQVDALPFIQRRLLPLAELPTHEALANHSSVEPVTLVTAILNQALAFMDDVLPAFMLQDASAISKPSTATVSVRSLERGAEKWTGRVSGHANRQIVGTASWEQFNDALKVLHNRHQIEHVSDIEDSYKVCDWSINDIKGWTDITCEVFDLLFKENFPSKPRACSVLTITGSSTQSAQFIVAQIPVDLTSAPGARYANGRNTVDIVLNKSPTMGKKTVLGEYIRIDRVRLDPESHSQSKGGSKTWWDMAISADDRSSVPTTLSKLASKNSIARDVGSFIKWVNNHCPI